MNARKKITPKKLGSASLLAAGMAICSAAAKAGRDHIGPDNAERYAARGACVDAMNALWYDQSTTAAREAFLYSSGNFFKACGWPD